MRYIIGVLVAAGLVVLIIILLVSGGTPAPQPINLNQLAGTDTKVRLIEQGDLTADQNRRSVEITVGRDVSEMDVIQGYQGHVIRSSQSANNQAAFAVFLHGLTLNGFNLGDNNPANSDERGHCALGQRYLYEVISPDGAIRQKYWNDTCGVGTFKGNASTIQTLFNKQIPNYDQLISGVNFFD